MRVVHQLPGGDQVEFIFGSTPGFLSISCERNGFLLDCDRCHHKRVVYYSDGSGTGQFACMDHVDKLPPLVRLYVEVVREKLELDEVHR